VSNNSPENRGWPHPYERPNDKWVCGRMEDGKPCRLGPDGHGRCRTTAECAPALEVKPGEQKGRYRCMRPPEFGGSCAGGPLPDGSCAHPQPRCAPSRSWRNRRGVFTWWVLGLSFAVLLLDFNGRMRMKFINPGPLSTAHRQPRGGNRNTASGEDNCAACHRSAVDSFPGWMDAAFGADPGPLDVLAFARPPSLQETPMDRACSACHRGHNFHHVRVNKNTSCLSCHQEHHGDAGLQAMASLQCAKCHGNSDYMAGQAVTNGTAHGVSGRSRGFVSSFSKDHPDFALLTSNASDSNSLRFNHQKHLSAEVVAADGGTLKCASCHEQDASGAYHKPIRFEQHCQSCHALQFDEANPQIHLPHGQVEFVQAFLASLPEQYERFGREGQRITERRALASFVQTQMRRIEEAQITGQSLAQRIFFNQDRSVPDRVGAEQGNRVAGFYGCAFCHHVTGNVAHPLVEQPKTPDRWLARGTFHHRSHELVDCRSCHQVDRSVNTSDLLLPGVSICATCHNAKSSPGESCVLCHQFHRARPAL
jgi:hypothetical protein